MLALGKYHGRQFAAAIEDNGIIGRERIEHLEKLGLGGTVVPFAVTAEQLEQLVDSPLRVAICMERGGEVEARLVIVGVCVNGGLQFANWAGVLCFFRQCDLGGNGFKRGIG